MFCLCFLNSTSPGMKTAHRKGCHPSCARQPHGSQAVPRRLSHGHLLGDTHGHIASQSQKDVCGSPMPVFASDRVCLSGAPEPQPPAVEYGVADCGKSYGSLGPLRQGEVNSSSGSHPLSTYIHQPFLCLCFDFLCVRPTMGNQGSASSSSLQGKRQTMKSQLGEIAEVV